MYKILKCVCSLFLIEYMSAERKVTFEEILKQQKTWTSYPDFASEVPAIISKEVAENARQEARLIEDLKKNPAFKKLTVRDVKPSLDKAEQLLADGKVVGVDA